MNKFKSLIDLIDMGNGEYKLEYYIFTPGRKYTQGNVTVEQIPTYDKNTQAIPGVRIEIKLEDNGAANPYLLQGNVNITSPIVITTDKPFVEVVYLVYDNAQGKYVGNGGGIVRGMVPA